MAYITHIQGSQTSEAIFLMDAGIVQTYSFAVARDHYPIQYSVPLFMHDGKLRGLSRDHDILYTFDGDGNISCTDSCGRAVCAVLGVVDNIMLARQTSLSGYTFCDTVLQLWIDIIMDIDGKWCTGRSVRWSNQVDWIKGYESDCRDRYSTIRGPNINKLRLRDLTCSKSAGRTPCKSIRYGLVAYVECITLDDAARIIVYSIATRSIAWTDSGSNKSVYSMEILSENVIHISTDRGHNIVNMADGTVYHLDSDTPAVPIRQVRQ